MTHFLDDRWSIEPADYDYVRHGAHVWVVSGVKRHYPNGGSSGPTYLCETTPDIAARIVKDHNAALDGAPVEASGE